MTVSSDEGTVGGGMVGLYTSVALLTCCVRVDEKTLLLTTAVRVLAVMNILLCSFIIMTCISVLFCKQSLTPCRHNELPST